MGTNFEQKVTITKSKSKEINNIQDRKYSDDNSSHSQSRTTDFLSSAKVDDVAVQLAT
jgi:hypothetical protein